MALKATIFKLKLDISDLTRHYYENHALTLARHPSETDERMMARVVGFTFNAHEHLEFTKGLSTDDEPDIWQKSLSGELDHWIDVGRPSEDRIRKACARSKQVTVYTFGGHTAEMWWKGVEKQLARFRNLRVFIISSESSASMASQVDRTMEMQCTIDDDTAWFSCEGETIEVRPQLLFPS